MIKYVYILSFIGVFISIVLCVFANIKKKSMVPGLVLTIFFSFLFIISVISDGYFVNETVKKIKAEEDKNGIVQGKRDLTDYQKKKAKEELSIISKQKWNKNNLDPISSGNLNLANQVLKKVMLLPDMLKHLNNIAEVQKSPDKYIGSLLQLDSQIVSNEILPEKNDITNIINDNGKVQALGLDLTPNDGKNEQEAVVYLHYNKERVIFKEGDFFDLEGIFVGIKTDSNMNKLIFMGR